MPETKLKPCPFCGGKAFMCGKEEKDYIEGKWYRFTQKVYWVDCNHDITCIYGKTHSRAFGVLGGIKFGSEEEATKAWNRRANDDSISNSNVTL